MKKNLSKIVFIFVICTIIYSCATTKRVPNGKNLLQKNEIFTNNKLVKDEQIVNLVVQQPNSSIFKIPIRLHLYNLAKKNPDSSYKAWLHRNPRRYNRLKSVLSAKQVEQLGHSFVVLGINNFLKSTGEFPIIIDTKKSEKSKKRLEEFYKNNGFLKTKATFKLDSVGFKKAKIIYKVETGKPYHIDSLKQEIESPVLDSLFAIEAKNSHIKIGKQYKYADFDAEIKRINKHFKNNGVYHFQENNVKFDAIQNDTTQKLKIILKIEDRNVKIGDSLVKKAFQIYKISQVNIFTNNTSKKDKNKVKDSLNFKGYQFYSSGKLQYKPKSILNSVFIEKDKVYSENDRILTSKSLNSLNVFNYPNIEYVEDPADSTKLIANIYLINKKRFFWQPSIDVTTSDIQQFGISGRMSLIWRNVFKRAENLEISTRANIGSSKDFANPKQVFFNIFEFGVDAKLNIPRILFPINTRNIIKKEMFPTTQILTGLAVQRNIGLDKQSLSGGINYNWATQGSRNKFKFELLNINYIRNLNISNYFNVYKTSYNTLNLIAQTKNLDPLNVDTNGALTQPGALNFMNQVVDFQTTLGANDDAYKTIFALKERYNRLTEDNLIISSSISFNRSTKNAITDHSYYNFKAKLESAGNLLSLIANVFDSNKEVTKAGTTKLFGIEYSQYIKTEVDFVKQWDLGKKNVVAIRSFAGIAIPYKNSNSIPFLRSYFAGGSNDNRGWQAYSLGPGSSGGINDFNEANLKLAFSAEYRFQVFGNFHSALFVDAGNIWNFLDNVKEKSYVFSGIKSLQDIAIGSGIGLRYDFDFFVFRVDLGYKTFDPSRISSEKWLRGINLGKTVLNFGINYPF